MTIKYEALKNEIITYYKIFREIDNKKEIVKYLLKRIMGKRPLFDKPVIITNDGGTFNCGLIIGNCQIACSHFEEEFKEKFNLKEGIFIDIGAHIGKWTISVARKLKDNGKVIAIEADRANSILLSSNVKLNKLKNVEVHNLACANFNGKTTFYKSKMFSSTNTIMVDDLDKERNRVMEKEIVITKKLDDIVNGRKVNFIKIDAERAEALILRGGWRL